MAVHPPICDFGWPAPDFELPGIDGKTWRLLDRRGANGTLVMFICNHCPYVKAVIDRIVRDCAELARQGIVSVAINANDPRAYPEDSFENMKSFAALHGIAFPYLFDATQAVAREWGAVCTPDFFGLDKDLRLQYRGRLDSSGKQPAAPDVRRELFEAMRQIATTGIGPRDQIASMGCSIKWRQSAGS